MTDLSWVEQVHAAEESWVALLSLDGDILVESLANLPEDAQGRLERIIDFAAQVRDSATQHHQLVVDTGLGTASWHLSFGDSSQDSEVQTEEQPTQPAAGGGRPLWVSRATVYSGPVFCSGLGAHQQSQDQRQPRASCQGAAP